MKLMKAFTDQVANCGKIQRVWLTSFTLDIEFIETFILPAILGPSVEQPRTRMDYEALQLALNEQEIDVRIFCDKRYISADQNKRTLIPVHGISPGRKDDSLAEQGFTEDSLFHAKVIYLEGSQGKVLGTGSANLTLSGWGRNREVFHFVPVDELTLYKSVRAFFLPLFANVGENCPLRNLRKFPRVRPRAQFCHSLQEQHFFEQLFAGGRHEELAVWSPYFSRDLAGFIHYLKQDFLQPDLTLRLVADRADGHYLRTKWSEGLAQLFADNELMLHQHPWPTDERVTMTHAKLWKTATHLAIGSWNCTHAGTHTRLDEDGNMLAGNNIEAGLILRDASPIDTVIGKRLDASPALFASDKQLEEDSLEIPETLPFDLAVTFDWGSHKYHTVGFWNRGKPQDDRFSIKLPDVAEPITLTWMPRKHALQEHIVPVENPQTLLTEHRYQVFRDGEIFGTGLLLELAPEYRRVQQYDSLKGLLDAMNDGGPEPSLDDVSFRVSETDDEEERQDRKTRGSGEARDPQCHLDTEELSYFRLFTASAQFAAKLRKANDIHVLDKWVFVRPGCLEEWVKKATAHIDSSEVTVFNWFLAQEVNSLCNLARGLRDKLPKIGDPLPLQRWQGLEVANPLLPPGAEPQYRETLEQEYQRMNKNLGVL